MVLFHPCISGSYRLSSQLTCESGLKVDPLFGQILSLIRHFSVAGFSKGIHPVAIRLGRNVWGTDAMAFQIRVLDLPIFPQSSLEETGFFSRTRQGFAVFSRRTASTAALKLRKL